LQHPQQYHSETVATTLPVLTVSTAVHCVYMPVVRVRITLTKI
jgi:hypothetical protein